jgi:hypothetical protein
LDTANSNSINNSNSDVSFFSPVSSPLVLDDVVLYTIFNSVSNSENGKIELGATISISNDSLEIMHEWITRTIKGHSNRLLSNSCFKLIGRILLDVFIRFNLNNSIRLGEARASESGIWVLRLCINWVHFSVIEASVLESTSTTSRVISTIKTLLLR